MHRAARVHGSHFEHASNGFEVGTGFHINPVPPEFAAGFLRDVITGANPAAVASPNGALSS